MAYLISTSNAGLHFHHLKEVSVNTDSGTQISHDAAHIHMIVNDEIIDKLISETEDPIKYLNEKRGTCFVVPPNLTKEEKIEIMHHAIAYKVIDLSTLDSPKPTQCNLGYYYESDDNFVDTN